MMKRISCVCAIVLVSVLALRLQAAPQTPALPTVDQVLDKYIAALGGRAAFEKITSRVMTGTIDIPDAGVSGTVQITEKAPDKTFALIEFAAIGSIREATDGVTAWEDNPQTGVREKTGPELVEAKRSATFNQEIRLKSVYPTMAVTGREQVGGRSAILVTATPAEGPAAKLYFDAETGLLIKQSATRITPQGPIEFDAYLEDYRPQDGIKQPFTIRQVTPMFTSVIRIAEMKHNVAVNDAIFKKPGAPTSAR